MHCIGILFLSIFLATNIWFNQKYRLSRAILTVGLFTQLTILTALLLITLYILDVLV